MSIIITIPRGWPIYVAGAGDENTVSLQLGGREPVAIKEEVGGRPAVESAPPGGVDQGDRPDTSRFVLEFPSEFAGLPVGIQLDASGRWPRKNTLVLFYEGLGGLPVVATVVLHSLLPGVVTLKTRDKWVRAEPCLWPISVGWTWLHPHEWSLSYSGRIVS